MLVFLGIAAVVAGLLLSYTLSHRPLPIPADPDHLRALDAGACLACHAPGAAHPRGLNHPLNDRCFSCHERS